MNNIIDQIKSITEDTVKNVSVTTDNIRGRAVEAGNQWRSRAAQTSGEIKVKAAQTSEELRTKAVGTSSEIKAKAVQTGEELLAKLNSTRGTKAADSPTLGEEIDLTDTTEVAPDPSQQV